MKFEFKRGNNNEGYDIYFECVTNKQIALCVSEIVEIFPRLNGCTSFVLNVARRNTAGNIPKTKVVLTKYAGWDSIPAVSIKASHSGDIHRQILKDTNTNFRKAMKLDATKNVTVYVWFTNIF